MPFSNGIWETKPLLQSILNDFQANIHQSIISARFHNSIVNAVRRLCSTIRTSQAINQVALSGGVWQNRFLFRKTVTALETDNFIVYTHHQVPTNDGGISLGQAWIAANNPQHFTV